MLQNLIVWKKIEDANGESLHDLRQRLLHTAWRPPGQQKVLSHCVAWHDLSESHVLRLSAPTTIARNDHADPMLFEHQNVDDVHMQVSLACQQLTKATRGVAFGVVSSPECFEQADPPSGHLVFEIQSTRWQT